MALICMAVYDTDENGRSEYTEKTLYSLLHRVDWSIHTLVIINNGSCLRTKKLLSGMNKQTFCTIITLSENIGTAKGINMGLRLRKPGENCIKIDNDVVIHSHGWVEEMEECIRRVPELGVVGLKRKDINFDPNHEKPEYRSDLVGLPHLPGEKWINVEKGNQIMGTCTMFSSALLDKIGYMNQPGLYGFDDVFFNLRSVLAGFWNCYLPYIDIDHIDDGSNAYTQVKQRQAGEVWGEYKVWWDGYVNGTRDLYYDGM